MLPGTAFPAWALPAWALPARALPTWALTDRCRPARALLRCALTGRCSAPTLLWCAVLPKRAFAGRCCPVCALSPCRLSPGPLLTCRGLTIVTRPGSVVRAAGVSDARSASAVRDALTGLIETAARASGALTVGLAAALAVGLAAALAPALRPAAFCLPWSTGRVPGRGGATSCAGATTRLDDGPTSAGPICGAAGRTTGEVPGGGSTRTGSPTDARPPGSLPKGLLEPRMGSTVVGSRPLGT